VAGSRAIYLERPLAQPWLYCQDEEDLDPRHSTTKHLMLALDPKPPGSARRAVQHAGLVAIGRFFIRIWNGQKLFYQQVLPNSYNHHAVAGVRTSHVVVGPQRLTGIEAVSDIRRKDPR
jgi:hypothetical protein